MFRLGTLKANICTQHRRLGTFRFAVEDPKFSLLWNQVRTLAKETAIAATEPEFTAEQVGWRFAIGTVILVGAYIAWPMIPLVMAADLDPGFKAGLSGLLGATPFLSKFVAVAVMGRPAYYYFKRTVYARLRRRFAGTPAE